MQAKTINRLRFHISHQRNPPGPGKLEEMNQMKISAEIGSATRLTAMASFDHLRPKEVCHIMLRLLFLHQVTPIELEMFVGGPQRAQQLSQPGSKANSANNCHSSAML
jgi:hypothetical protein